MKFKISATIPTTQYGNIMPEIEVEARSYKQAYARVMPKIEEIWSRYCEPGRELRSPSQTRDKLEAFVGGTVYYDPIKHEYSNEAGEVYLSGSAYAHKFEKPFDQAKIAEAMAKKRGVSAGDIIKMWELKAEISRGLGTALHGAMELYGRYDGLAKSMERSALHDNPMVMKAVELFFAQEELEPVKAVYEAVVVDHAAKRAGRIDRLVLDADTKNCVIEDFKTDTAIKKKLPIYGKQLNFYRAIMEAGGWSVPAMLIHHWNGEQWTPYNMEREDV